MVAAVVAAILLVSASGPYASISEALAEAQPGDTILVRGGVHPALVIDKSVTIRGEAGAVIDGGGIGDVVTIDAPGVVLEGFELRKSGTVMYEEHAGVTVLQPDVVVRNNTIHDVLFGIYVKQGDNALIEGNHVVGYDFDVHSRGDGLRAWYSNGAQFIDNHVEQTRDVILWFSNDAVVEGNVITDGRYGLHFMYDDRMVVRGNEVRDNSVGMFLMYSSNVTVDNNLIADSFGPSGYGIGLKEIANLEVTDNVILRNRIGVSFDTVPHGQDAFASFTGNLVAFNHAGMSFQPSTERVELVTNSFDRNGTQIEIRGGGDLEGNVWNFEQGNYWSDYVGYDADGDGVGDLPYEPQSLFESMRDENPVLALFNYGPAALAVDFAARAVPNLRPSPKVVDGAPLTSNSAPAWFEAGRSAPAPLLGLTAVLAAFGVLVTRGMSRGFEAAPTLERVATTIPVETAGEVLQTWRLTKRYGERTVLSALDLTVNRGEAVALWGGNGAGKTTAIRCVVGVIKHEGEVVVNGLRLSEHPKDVRRAIGYVPQDQQLPDLPSRDLLAFFGALRDVDEAEFLATAALVGIEDHLDKRPNELSGGLRQRLALALALLGDPPLLLLDEPTANLDAATRESIFALLDEKRSRGTSVVFTTHRADEVIAFADRVITLEDGRSVDEASADVFARGLESTSTNILIRVAEDDLTRARALLAAAGLSVAARAGWLTVRGAAPDEPIRILLTEHVEILESAIGSQR